MECKPGIDDKSADVLYTKELLTLVAAALQSFHSHQMLLQEQTLFGQALEDDQLVVQVRYVS